jgi:hypothetical protein
MLHLSHSEKFFNGIKISISSDELPKFLALYTAGAIIPTFALPKEQPEWATNNRARVPSYV